jgi:glycosyltransferase involved in cell wall biosynthesis
MTIQIQHAPVEVGDEMISRSVRHVVTSTISLIIPTLNEERNIAAVLRRIPDLVDEVIIVDGRSRDRTIEAALAVRPDARIVLEPRRGKGAAVRAGFKAATGDLVVMIDADCSMDPQDIGRYVELLASGADLVKGSRFLPGGGTVDMSPLRMAGNRALLSLVNIMYGSAFTELCYGYMALRRSRLDELALRSDGFEIETEIVVRALRTGLLVREVPSFEERRAFGESNLSTFSDGWRVLQTLVMERFRNPAPLTTPGLGELDAD